jgi:hypothetical protein
VARRPRVVLAVSALCAACSGPPGATALYDTSRPDFFAQPWPSQDRLSQGQDGRLRLDLNGFYNPGAGIGQYLQTIGGAPLGGFGTHSSIYFRFDAPIDPTTLPADSAASVAAEATAFVVDVTPGSPDYGRRTPVRAHFSTDEGLYIKKNWLALLPEPGFPLRGATRYAAVLTDGLRAADGGPVKRAPTLPAVPDDVAAALGVPPAHVVSFTVFSTQDPTSIMHQLRDAVLLQAPPPVPLGLQYDGINKARTFDLYEGTYLGPNFQEGDPPYVHSGGAIHKDDFGHPIVVRLENLRFALTVPRAPMPPGGWPVVLYAHGTGGDYLSFVGDGSAATAAQAKDEDGNVIANLAMISIDQVLHGPRDPTMSDPDFTFFNLQNIAAARDNPKQGALDDFQLLRLVQSFSVAAAPVTGNPLRFDASHIYFKGHSQGGLTGPLFLAYEPGIKAAILSGAGADLAFSLLGKTQPVDIPKLVDALVGENVDEYHPLLAMVQTYFEDTDPGNYGRLFFREPPFDLPPKSIYQSLGVVDHFTPIPTIKALALAMGVQPANPMIEPIDALPLDGLSWGDAPITKNVAGGAATGVLCEYLVPLSQSGMPEYDGHFVVFDDPHAEVQSNAFLATDVTSGVAQLIQ